MIDDQAKMVGKPHGKLTPPLGLIFSGLESTLKAESIFLFLFFKQEFVFQWKKNIIFLLIGAFHLS